MALRISEEPCYTFLWELENSSYSLEKKGEKIESPSFVVDEINQTKWKLWFYPRGDRDEDWIACYLRREADSKGESSIKIKYELALIRDEDSDSDNNSLGIFEHAFSKNNGCGYSKFVKREDVFLIERSIFLQQDTLKVRCRIWKSVGKMAMDVRCFARTRLGVQKRSSYIIVKNFSTLESDKKSTYRMGSLESYLPLIDVDLTLTGGLSSFSGGIIRFGLTLQDPTVKYCTLRLNLVDASKNIVLCNQEEFWFNWYGQSFGYPARELRKEFPFFFTKKQLMAMKSLYLPDDTLMIHWELAISKGILSSETEEVEFPIFSKLIEHTSSKSKFSNICNNKISHSKDLIEL